MGIPLLAHYNASKYAVEGIVDSLRFETLPFNVRVHSIQAGLFGTNFVKKGLVANAKITDNEGPFAQPIADVVKKIIEDIFVPVGVEAETFVPLRKELSDKAFEVKIKKIFGI